MESLAFQIGLLQKDFEQDYSFKSNGNRLIFSREELKE